MDPLIKIGKPTPDFTLQDLEGSWHTLKQHSGKVLILNFWSAECPWVERTDAELLEALHGWGEQVELICIASNQNEPLELLQKVSQQRGIPLVLQDKGAETAQLYRVQITPQLFVLDEERRLRYKGAFDNVTFRQRKATRHYLPEAVEALLQGKEPNPATTTPYGCAIVLYAS